MIFATFSKNVYYIWSPAPSANTGASPFIQLQLQPFFLRFYHVRTRRLLQSVLFERKIRFYARGVHRAQRQLRRDRQRRLRLLEFSRAAAAVQRTPARRRGVLSGDMGHARQVRRRGGVPQPRLGLLHHRVSFVCQFLFAHHHRLSHSLLIFSQTYSKAEFWCNVIRKCSSQFYV